MHPEHLDLLAFLSGLRGCHCQLLRFPGNYGDSLIWHGTQSLLTRAGIRYDILECDHPPSGKVLIVDGGGNLNDCYHDVERYLTRYSSRLAQVIILPHSVAGIRALSCLSRHCPEATIFCRERATFESVRMTVPFADVRLAHDCAFAADVTPWANVLVEKNEPLFAFRRDVETLYSDVPDSNRDLSLEGYAMAPLGPLMEAICEYGLIHTDRLHLAIAGALLQRQVFLYPNSYFKNRAVFEYSLSRLSHVRFVAAPTGPVSCHL